MPDNNDDKKLKLYVWTNVLKDYTSGIAFALAESPDHARYLICREKPGKYGYFLDGHPSISRFRGNYDPDAIYNPGDIIKYTDDKRYIVTQDCIVQGIAPKSPDTIVVSYPWTIEAAGQWHYSPKVHARPYGYSVWGGG